MFNLGVNLMVFQRRFGLLLLLGLLSAAVLMTPLQAQDGADADAGSVGEGTAFVWPVVADPNVDPVIFAVNQHLEDGSEVETAPRDDLSALTDFYKASAQAPVWVGDNGWSDKAKAAAKELALADNWGLESKDYPLPTEPSVGASADNKAVAEIAFGLTVLKYARHARQGRVRPSSVTSINDFPGLTEEQVASMWREIVDAPVLDKYLRGLHPHHPQFEKLRQALLEARGVSELETGALPQPPKQDAVAADARHALPDGDDLTPGMQHPDIVDLRKRLGVEADLGANPHYFDAPLAKAVTEFQEEAGLVPTGNLDEETRKRLNAALLVDQDAGDEDSVLSNADETDDRTGGKKYSKHQVQLILNNMERWRWLPDDLGDLYVWNNVPEYRTRVFKGTKTIFSERIIVGLPEWATPSFMAKMKYVIFHPSWGVPPGIKRKELLPRLQRAQPQSIFDFFGGGGGGSAAVLKAYNLKVYRNGQQINPDGIKWNSSNIHNYSFVQPPGSKNPLGIVKFRFPNKHNVYMHDTIERELFSKSSRAYSHGCIRVRDPIKFAAVLLGEGNGISEDAVRSMSRSGRSVTLDQKIPVYTTYMTARIDDKGKLQSFGDVYGRDGRLARQLGKDMRFERPKVATPKPSSSSTRSASVKKKKQVKKKSASRNSFPQTINQAISGRYN